MPDPSCTPCLHIGVHISNGNTQQDMNVLFNAQAFLQVRFGYKAKSYQNYDKSFNTSVQCGIRMHQKPNTACIQRFECDQGALLTESKRKHGIANLSYTYC